jgi:hypothetical protein
MELLRFLLLVSLAFVPLAQAQQVDIIRVKFGDLCANLNTTL